MANSTESPNNSETGTAEPFDNTLIHEASEKSLALANGKCGACQRRGFPLLLVRKSVVPDKFKSDVDWSAGMCSLDDREPEKAFTTHQYAYRTLREGYVYLLLEPKQVVHN